MTKYNFLSSILISSLFIVLVSCNGGTKDAAKTKEAEVQSFLQNAGAKEVNVQNAETGWWIGTYDKEQKLYKEELGY